MCIRDSSRTLLTGGDILDSKDLAGAAAYELHALPGQVAYRAVLFRQDGAGGENAQAQEMSEIPRIAFVATVLQAFVFLDRDRIGQMHLVTGFL